MNLKLHHRLRGLNLGWAVLSLALFCLAPLLAHAQLPSVSVSTSTKEVYKWRPEKAYFKIDRTGPTTGTLLVSFEMAGNAVPGVDYTLAANSVPIPVSATSSVPIPEGASSIDIEVQKINDTMRDVGDVNVRLELKDIDKYLVNTSSGNITILEDRRLHDALGDPKDIWSNSELPWMTTLESPWTPNIYKTSPQSGAIDDATSTSLYTDVTGPANISFWWQVSSEQDKDFLRFFVDDCEITSISGEIGWVQYEVPPIYYNDGQKHRLQWAYQKNETGIGGNDRGWLADIEIKPIVMKSLDQSLDCGLGWVPTASLDNWYGQDRFTVDGKSAALSGDILPGRSKSMFAFVNGPATLSFWWMNNTTAMGNRLSFSIDGDEKAFLDGDEPWQKGEVYIPAGEHGISFDYSKNNAKANFSFGAVDEIKTFQFMMPSYKNKWFLGQTYTIQWKANVPINGNVVKISLLRDGSVVGPPIKQRTSNTGTFKWKVPANLIPDSFYQIRIASAANQANHGDSYYLRITPFDVLKPTYNAEWVNTKSYPIRWDTNKSFVGKTVKITLFKRVRNKIVFDRVIKKSVSNNGSYNWSVPQDLLPNPYFIEISATRDPAIMNDSPVFIISPISVRSPIKGAAYLNNTKTTIRWDSNTKLVGKTVRIELLWNGVPIQVIKASAPNSGSYSWVVPPFVNQGEKYQISIMSTQDRSIRSDSATFNINY